MDGRYVVYTGSYNRNDWVYQAATDSPQGAVNQAKRRAKKYGTTALVADRDLFDRFGRGFYSVVWSTETGPMGEGMRLGLPKR